MSSTVKSALLHGAKDIRIEQHPQRELSSGMVRLRNRRVGICGSDLHYYEHGYCGAFVPIARLFWGTSFALKSSPSPMMWTQ